MAEEKKAVLERDYIIPLRKGFLKAPRWKRAKKAVSTLKSFVARHMKAKEVKVGKYLNEEIWEHGIKNPPHKVKVHCTKDEEGVVTAESVNAPKEVKELKKPEMKQAKKGVEEVKSKDIKQEEKKEIEKEEIKELKKEKPKIHAPKQPIIPKKVESHPTAPRSV